MKRYISILLTILLLLSVSPAAFCASAAEVGEALPIAGDADLDGVLTILDATAVQRYLAGLPVETFSEAAADADLDGIVTVMDSTAVRRTLAGLGADAPRIMEALILVPTGAGENILYSVKYNPATGKGTASYTFTDDELDALGRLEVIRLGSHFADVTDELIERMYELGMPELSKIQKAQWFGEILLHFFGLYVKRSLDNWDYSKYSFNDYLDSLSASLRSCVSAEMDYNNGEIGDLSHGKVSDLINMISARLGIVYFIHRAR